MAHNSFLFSVFSHAILRRMDSKQSYSHGKSIQPSPLITTKTNIYIERERYVDCSLNPEWFAKSRYWRLNRPPKPPDKLRNSIHCSSSSKIVLNSDVDDARSKSMCCILSIRWLWNICNMYFEYWVASRDGMTVASTVSLLCK